jgi:hypothetical protein
MTDTLTVALDYAGQGLRVLPIMPGGKRPPMRAWQDAATTDPETIRLWWTGLYADHGVGIATGAGSGIFVLDVDVADGKAGDETLRELEDSYGPLTDTVRTITGSGGAHHYYRLPAGVEIRNDSGRKLGAGLDIRGEGGQVVAPPTIHPTSGRAYEWEDGCSPDEIAIAEAPRWLIALLTVEPEQPAPSVAPVDRTGDDGPAARYNESTTWHELLSADGWTLGHTDRDGCQHWVRPGKDPREGTSATVGYQGRDILRVFTSSIPDLPEGAYNRFGYTAATRHHGNRSAFATELLRNEGPLPPLKPLTPWAPETTPNSNPTTRLELAHLVDWQRFWDNDQSDENWLAYPIVPAGRAIALYAPAKAGKSTITLAIAAAVATGRPVLGKRIHPITEVLYLDYEMTPADLQQRLLELGYGPDDDLEHLHYALLPSLPPLDTIEGATAVLELIDTTGAEFVVVDTFGRAVGGEEDHADTVRAFYRHTGLSLKARGVTYLRTDHSGKDVAKGMRGSSAKNDDVDLVWQLSRTDTKDGHALRLKRTHSRISWVPEEVKVKRIETDDGFDYLVDGDVKVRPDGTRQIMEQMIALGITATTGQRPAAEILKEAGIKVKVREMREALGMLKETTANGLSVVPDLTPWTPKTARQDSVAVETAQPRQDSVAVGSNSVALVAVKGHMGSERDREEGTSVALDDEYRDTNASPLGLALSHQPTGTDEWLF